MILPINRTPNIRTYAHHAYIDAIISAEEYVGDKKAQVYIKDYEKNTWTQLLKRINTEVIEQNIFFYASNYEINPEGIIFRKCKEKDEIIIEIKYFQFSDPDAVINLFLCQGNPQDCINNNSKIIRFLNMRKYGIGFSVNERFLNSRKRFFDDNEYSMKLIREKNKISAFVSKNGDSWEEFYTAEMEGGGESVYIGLNVNFGRVQYYDWLYSNYIQIFGSLQHPMIHIDYFLEGMKSGSFNYLNQFLDFRFDYYSYLKSLDVNIVEYCKLMLNQKFYIALYLDEYYIQKRNSYQKRHFIHQNLLYGFEDDYFYMMGYGINNILEFTKLSKTDILKAYTDNSKLETIKLIRYDINSVTYKFSKSVLFKQLEEYLYGINSSKHFANVVPGIKSIYGTKQYREYLEKSDYQKLYLNDMRIAYLISERMELMIKRIEFLRQRNVLSAISAAIAAEIADDAGKLANECKNLIIKYKFVKQKDDIENIIMQKLKKLQKQDKKLCKYLLNEMEEN